MHQNGMRNAAVPGREGVCGLGSTLLRSFLLLLPNGLNRSLSHVLDVGFSMYLINW